MTVAGGAASAGAGAGYFPLVLVSLSLFVGSLASWLRRLRLPVGPAETALFSAAVGVMVLAVVLAFRWPFRSVALFFLGLPILNVARKWVASDEGSATVPSSVLLWALLVVVLLRTRPTRDGVRVAGLARPLLAYVAAGFASVAAAWFTEVPQSRALVSALTGVLEPSALLYLTYLCVRIGGEGRRTAGGLVYGVAGCVVLWGVLYHLGAGQTVHAGGLDDPGVVRSLLGSMTFGNALHFSIAALVAVPLAFLEGIHPPGGHRILRPAVLALLLFGLGVGFSRGALLALALELCILARARVLSRAVLLVFLPAVAAAFAMLFGPIVLMRLADLGGLPSGELNVADASRLEAWRVAVTSILHHPLGIGGGNFDFAWGKWSHFTVLFQEIGGPHNLWLSVGAEYGIPFLLLFAALVLACLRGSVWLARRAPRRASRRLGAALAAALAGFIVAGTVGDVELSHLSARNKPMNMHTLVLFAALGLLVAERQGAGESRTPGATGATA
jgi:O-antigen ligase